MADITSSPHAGEYSDFHEHDGSPVATSNPLTTLTNVAGAAVSLALIAGIGVWGYKLLVRDVSGIPVVRAAQGDMRVRPEEPGGQLARHQGLSVNAVAAVGTAGKPADQLRLAPRATVLADEDQPMKTAMVAPAPQAPVAEAAPEPAEGTNEVSAEKPAEITQPDAINDLVAELTAGVAPLQELEAEVIPAVTAVAPDVTEAVNPLADKPGVRQSLRPRKRPAERAIVMPASLDTSAAVAEATKELSADELPKGTRLVQLGAFDSPEVARSQWDKLSGRFDAYMEGKSRIIQKATSGGRVFYRLRAHGFEDIADARRFCSALVAEKADCIPVVTR